LLAPLHILVLLEVGGLTESAHSICVI
jgi:hypothetical protein